MTEILPFIQTSVKASLKVLCLVLIGVLLRRRGIVDSNVTKGLAGILVNVVSPAFLFSKIIENMTFKVFLGNWVLLVFHIVYLAIGAAIGNLMARFVFKVKKSDRGFIISACMFNNSVSLPLAFVMSLHNIARLQESPDETDDDIQNEMISYILFYSIFATTTRWMIGFPLLSSTPKTIEEEEEEEEEENVVLVEEVAMVSIVSNDPENKNNESGQVEFLSEEENEEDFSDDDVLIGRNQFNKNNSMYTKFLGFISDLKESSLARIFTPPVVTSFVALGISFITSLRNVFLPGGIFDFWLATTSTVSKAIVPIVMIILGSKMSNGPSSFNEFLTPWLILAINFVQLVLFPVIGIALIWFSRLFIEINKKLALVLLLECATPVAINLVVLCSIQENREKEMMSVVFYCYLPAIVTLCFWIALFLYIV